VLSACLLATALPAQADLRLCNFTDSRIGVAIGYRGKRDWVTEGWWNILSQSCEVLLPGEITSRFYYVYAVDYDRGGEWKGKDRMCIADKAFTIEGVGSCEERGYKQVGFYEVDTGEAKSYTIRLVEPGDRIDTNQ
jgi:uncharacterized membrane protein